VILKNDEFVTFLRTSGEMSGTLAHFESIPAREGRFREPASALDPRLAVRLNERGCWPLYLHQALAVDAAMSGRNVFIATPAASGKSLGYQIPVVQSLLENPRTTVLYLAPTKALEQDQCRHFRELFCPGLIGDSEFGIIDGDTPGGERATIRRGTRFLLSNPDMLHVSILPRHQQWRRFLSNLKYVVIDEAHQYRGVFGSHLALILRRLRRLCRRYGATPQFILASATIDNAAEFGRALVGEPVEVVDQDGAPYGGKDFIFWNPPLTDPARSQRRSASAEATVLFAEAVARGIRTLAFARTRRLAEVMSVHARDRLTRQAPEQAERVKAYRAGYLAEDRRRIEQELFNGRLTGAVATSALELGIDIGDLEATILTGYPGSIASAWQQAGRSGRRAQRSVSIMVARNDPLDQYFMRHPSFFFGRSSEAALVNPDNIQIMDAHLRCAAWELPLTGGDRDYFGEYHDERLAVLTDGGQLTQRRGAYYPATGLSYPAGEVSIRGLGGTDYLVIDGKTGAILERLDAHTALFQLFPGAVYLHQGESYIVRSLNGETRMADVERHDEGYYTEARDITDLRVMRVLRHTMVRGHGVSLGEVEVTETVVGFRRKAQFSEEVLGEEPLDLPPQSFRTIALWFELSETMAESVGALGPGRDFAGGLHAVEHAAIGILPLRALCDRNDIGGLSTPLHPDTGAPTVFIYDAHAGGVGIAEKGFDIITELWQTTLDVVAECPCEDGCPGCIQSPKCGNNNEPLDKQAAILLLRGLLGIREVAVAE
jgi:DEAD/DEAH box helicase domain-containing protein